MAKRKTPARNAKGRFIKKRKRNAPKRNAPKRRRTTRKRRKPSKKGRKRKASGTTVIVRANSRRKRRKARRRRNPAMPPWAKVVLAAGGVAVAVELVKAYVPIEALKTPAAQNLMGPVAALGAGVFFSRKARTKSMGYALIGAGVWQLAKYGSQYVLAKIAVARGNPYHRRSRMVRRETRGVPADQKPRLAAGYTSIPMTEPTRAGYTM